MKKRISFLLSAVLIVLVIPIAAYALWKSSIPDRQTIDIDAADVDNGNISVSDVMTFEEMASQYADSGGIAYEEALTVFPASAKTQEAASYRTLSVSLPVTSAYKPHLEFYCQTSEDEDDWEIVSLYSMQLVRSDGNMTKQFHGELSAWLRSGDQIEFSINGDFYNTGRTSVTNRSCEQTGADELYALSYSLSAVSVNHYQYCYEHQTVAFQS